MFGDAALDERGKGEGFAVLAVGDDAEAGVDVLAGEVTRPARGLEYECAGRGGLLADGEQPGQEPVQSPS